MLDEKSRNEDDKPTKEKILDYIYEYGPYVLFGMAAGLAVKTVIKAML